MEYSELVFKQYVLSNKKNRTIQEEEEVKSNATNLTKMELQMSSNDIIVGIREAFKHIPSRI